MLEWYDFPIRPYRYFNCLLQDLGIQSWTTPLTDSYDVLPMQVSYAELSKLNKSILLAIYLSYRVLLGVLGEWSTTLTVSADTYYYRGRLLQSIGKALEDKGVATSDDTMHKLFNMVYHH